MLGSILQDNAALEEALGKLRRGPATFYDNRNQSIYEAIVEIHSENKPVDVLTLTQKLTDNGLIGRAGGAGYVASLPDLSPSPANIGNYISIVLEKFALRQILATCSTIIGEVYDHSAAAEASALIGKLSSVIETQLQAVSGDDSQRGFKVVTAVEASREAIDRMDWRHSNKDKLSGLPTGLQDLDWMTDGLQPGELAIIAARPSQGKTAIGMDMVSHVCLDLQIPTLVFSLEMSSRSLVTRLMCGRSEIDSMNVRRGQMTGLEMSKLAGFYALMKKSPLIFVEGGNQSINSARAIARRFHKSHKLGFIVVDYLQKMKPDEKNEKRTYEVAAVSGGLKEMARELNIPVLALCQLNRDSDKGGQGGSRRPVLSDLGDSGQIERDADLVGLLYRVPQQPNPREFFNTELIIAKQRDGATGTIPLIFFRKFTKFKSGVRSQFPTPIE